MSEQQSFHMTPDEFRRRGREVADWIVYQRAPQDYDTHAGVDWTIAAVTQVTTLTNKVVIDAGAGTILVDGTAGAIDLDGALEVVVFGHEDLYVIDVNNPRNSATYTWPTPSTATPEGPWNSPSPVPGVPQAVRNAPELSNFWIRWLSRSATYTLS